MSGKVCREARREIDQSELRQTLSVEVEAHLAGCAACAAFRDERSRLRELVGALEPVVAPPEVLPLEVPLWLSPQAATRRRKGIATRRMRMECSGAAESASWVN